VSVPAYLPKLRGRLADLTPPPPGIPFVLLVTGSRDAETDIWIPVVGDCLVAVDAWLRSHNPDAQRIKILRHGGSRGIDTIAHVRSGSLGFHRDRMPADWGHWGRRSGIIRNTSMVTKQPVASLCLAFFAAARSRGTADCAAQAHRAGIPTISITVEDLYLPHVKS
jgi:hypothetical protein